MKTPILLLQGFQQAYLDIGHPSFSGTAAVRRDLCEKILRHARQSGWTVVHSFISADMLGEKGARTLESFSPLGTESYFRQPSWSAFKGTALGTVVERQPGSPIFLMSFGGLEAIGATFFDGVSKDLPVYVVGDAIGHAADGAVREVDALNAVTAMARTFGRYIEGPEIGSFGERANELGVTVAELRRGEQRGLRRTPAMTDTSGLLMMAQYIQEEAPGIVANPRIITALLDLVKEELQKALEAEQNLAGRHRGRSQSSIGGASSKK